ncbi:MAG: hypothetical protein EOM14_12580 [Clostridia bacterium]|nr:hypothetical protein [Clostridia bacterium]
MERLSDEARGYAVIKAVGADPTRLIDRCAAERIDFWGVYPDDDLTLTFCTRLKQAERVLSFAGKCCCDVEITEKHGIPIEIKKIKKRYVLWVLPLLLLILLVTSSFFIWKIEITGNETVSDIEILNALEDSGVYIGSFHPSFTSDNIRSRVLVRIPELKWISVSVFGSRAYVEVRERTDIPDILDENEAVKIVAEQSGIIENVSVLRGYPLFEKGQTAAEDDTLIDGVVPSTFSETEIVHAEGSVIARTWYEICAVMPLQYTEKAYTGKSKSHFALIIGDNRINFYSRSRIFDTDCDNIINRQTLGIEGLFELPVTLVSELAETYELVDVSVPDTIAKSMLEVLLNGELKRVVGEDGEIVSTEYTFSIIDDFAVGTLRAECRQNIAAEEEMTADEIRAAKEAKEEQNTE